MAPGVDFPDGGIQYLLQIKGDKDSHLWVNWPLTLPQTKRKIPFEDYEVGKMKPGITAPSKPDYDSLEVRIPWTMLGYTDPSTLRVWDYPYEADGIKSVKVECLRIYPTVRNPGQTSPEEIEPLDYSWDGWDQPTYHERKKQSYYFLKKEFERHDQVAEPQ